MFDSSWVPMLAMVGVSLILPHSINASGRPTQRRGNRLAGEKSPYLLQHAGNPVDWYPWGVAALERSRLENKLIFLSIGYSTCHWCHVMERESFEDSEVAAVLNSHFVAIKVDREERPDLDQVYMRVCQMISGSGGWPLTVFLTPDRRPFFAGTYFPKQSRLGRPGLMDLLHRAQDMWQSDPERVVSQAADIVSELTSTEQSRRPPSALTPDLLGEAARFLGTRFDTTHGGFGTAPKFPSPHQLTYLLERHRRTGDPAFLEMVEKTLIAMRRGGIYDQVGFGFHRYSTDAEWLIPHFEKMLYDQAGLAVAYLEAYQVTGNPEYRDTVTEIFAYAARELTAPEGGFYTAEDADSEGEEGRFYVWTRSEILDALGPEDGDWFAKVYGVSEKGNFSEMPGHDPGGRNIFHQSRELGVWAQTLGVSEQHLEERLEASRAKLLALRGTRVRPHLDDKILAGWNGLMISALARGGAVLDDAEAIRAASRAADFILARMYRDERLLRRYRGGEAGIPGFAEDYAFLARGLLDLYGAAFEIVRLQQAVGLAEQLFELFGGEDGGLYDTPCDGEPLVLRPREPYDGAYPSAHSVAVEICARLTSLTGDLRWRSRTERLLAAYAPEVRAHPAGFTHLLRGASLALLPGREVVVTGDPGAGATRALLSVMCQGYAPETTTLLVPNDHREAVEALVPFVHGMRPVDGRAAAYVCENFSCQAPTTSPTDLAARVATPPKTPAIPGSL